MSLYSSLYPSHCKRPAICPPLQSRPGGLIPRQSVLFFGGGDMTGAVRRLLAAAVLTCVSASMAFAQAGQSLSGVVVDGDGGVIPGASVAVRNNGTGESFEAVTNDAGAFSVPAIAVGTYS